MNELQQVKQQTNKTYKQIAGDIAHVCRHEYTAQYLRMVGADIKPVSYALRVMLRMTYPAVFTD